jgi:hypothetical protein
LTTQAPLCSLNRAPVAAEKYPTIIIARLA